MEWIGAVFIDVIKRQVLTFEMRLCNTNCNIVLIFHKVINILAIKEDWKSNKDSGSYLHYGKSGNPWFIFRHLLTIFISTWSQWCPKENEQRCDGYMYMKSRFITYKSRVTLNNVTNGFPCFLYYCQDFGNVLFVR